MVAAWQLLRLPTEQIFQNGAAVVLHLAALHRAQRLAEHTPVYD